MSGYIGPQPVVEATQNRESFTATTNQNSFATAGYQVGYLDIFLNGVKLAPADYTATNGSDVVLTADAAAGDILEVTSYSAFSLVSPDFTGDTTAVNLTVTGNLEFSSLSGTGSVAVTDILDEDNMASNSPTKLSTQQAIKAYVDSSSGAGLPLSGGTMTGDIAFGDADKAIFGAGSNLEVFHEGNSLIRTTSGSQNLVIKSQATGYDLFLDSARDVLIRGVGGENGIKVIGNGAVELYHNNVKKIETTATGVDVTGTVAADGLTVDITDQVLINHSGDGGGIRIDSTNATNTSSLRFGDVADNYIGALEYNHSNDAMTMYVNNATRMTINSSGYVGIGTSPSFILDVVHPTDNGLARFTSGDADAYITISDVNSTSAANKIGVITHDMYFNTNGTERMRIDSSGNVGIGSSTANHFSVTGTANVLGVKSSSGALVSIAATGTNFSGIDLGTDSLRRGGVYSLDGSVLGFYTNPTNSGTGLAEAMRIDSSGNVLVGQTTASSNATGTSLRADGRNFYCADGNYSAHFNRKSSDGPIVHFAKDDTIVGNIGNRGDSLFVQSNASNRTGLDFSGAILPRYAGSLNSANNVDIGAASYKFKDLYLSGGVYLGGTGSANKISDYETGNWTPVLKFGGANVGMTGTFIGKYIKVGNLLTVSGQLTLTAKGSSTGNVLVTGLPFTTGTTAVMSFTNYHLSYNSMIWGQIYANQFSIYEATTGGTRTSIDNTNFSADTSISFSATYPLT